MDQVVEPRSSPQRGVSLPDDTDEERLEVDHSRRDGSHQNWSKEQEALAQRRRSSDTKLSVAGIAFSHKKKTKVLCACGAAWLLIGLLFFWSEGYGLVDSLYSLIQIITTVGYGDIVPETDQEKIITALIVLSSTLLMAGIVSHMIDVLLDAQAEMLAETLQAKEEQIRSEQSDQHEQANHRCKTQVVSRLAKLKQQAAIQATIFVSFIVAGTLFFGFFESCACPDDFLGCHLDPHNCEESGGIERSFVDTFYMTVVTITTVGYGDIVPQTLIGRIFGGLYMLFGVGSTLNLVGTLTDLLKEAFESDELVKLTHEVFMKMDMDGDGNLDRHEFLRLQLIMLGLAQEEELNSIDLQFDLIDSSGDGFISKEEFHKFYL
jgi:potassium channel subfamily K